MNVIVSNLYKIHVLAPAGKIFKESSDYKATIGEEEMKTFSFHRGGSGVSFITPVPTDRLSKEDWSYLFERHLIAL